MRSKNENFGLVQALEQAPEEALGGFGISALLNEDVEHNAVLIHAAPKIVLYALDPDEHLVQVPLVPGPWPSAAQAVGKAPAEFLAPAPHSLIGDDNATFSQEQQVSKGLRDGPSVVSTSLMVDTISVPSRRNILCAVTHQSAI